MIRIANGGTKSLFVDAVIGYRSGSGKKIADTSRIV